MKRQQRYFVSFGCFEVDEYSTKIWADDEEHAIEKAKIKFPEWIQYNPVEYKWKVETL